MYRRFCRLAAVLLLTALAVAPAAALPPGSRTPTADGFLESLWNWIASRVTPTSAPSGPGLASIWAAAGCMMDPNGKPCLDAGGMMDPDGQPTTDEGPMMDPNG